MQALMDLPRSGRPVTYDAKARVRIIAVVCEALSEHKLPLSRFSITDLLKIVVQEEGLASLSHASLGRTFGGSRCVEAVAISILALPS